MRVLNVRHTGLVVGDIKKSIKFYRDFLGLRVWKRKTERGRYIETVTGIDGAIVKWAKLKSPDGALVELLEYSGRKLCGGKAKPRNAHSDLRGCSHLAFTVADINAFHKKMVDTGYHCVNRPCLSPDRKAKVMYCHDPDGIMLEIVQEINSGPKRL